MAPEAPDLKSTLLNDFAVLEKNSNGKAKSSLWKQRKEAIHVFETLGFPTVKHEEWKYSNLKNLIAEEYNFHAPSNLSAVDLARLEIPNIAGNILYFLNGVFEPALSTIVSPREQVIITPIADAVQNYPEEISKYLNKIAKSNDESFTALNTAFSLHGIFIHVAKNQVVTEPIILRFVSDARQGNVGAHPRNLVVVEENAQVKFCESFRTVGDNRSLTNIVTEVFVEDRAHVEYYKVQDESENAYHVGTTQVRTATQSRFYAATVTLNGRFIRNNLNIELAGEQSDVHMYGLYCPDDAQHIDNHTLVDHQAPNSMSNELYKGILRGKSVGVFNGKIYVRPDAQKTNAYQSCKNIVLSHEAKMNTKPQLEIFADDVKCSHGTTTGQLDEEALFYLRSRGIPKDRALSLLMNAFCEDVLEQIRIEPIREYLEKAVVRKLAINS